MEDTLILSFFTETVFQMVNSNKSWNTKLSKSFNPLRMFPPPTLITILNSWKLLSKKEFPKDSSLRTKKDYSIHMLEQLFVMIPFLKNIGISISLLKKLPKVHVLHPSTQSCTTPQIYLKMTLLKWLLVNVPTITTGKEQSRSQLALSMLML